MSKKTRKILIIVVFVIGLSLILYPVIGNTLNNIRNNWQINNYEQVVQKAEPNKYDKLFEQAKEFNKLLPGIPTVYETDTDFYNEYKNALSLDGGMMGFLEIEKLNIKLSIFHGTSEGVLQNSLGYLEGTHLPTGDIGNSTVITGHTGLPSAQLLTDLDQLQVGDTFKLVILNRTFTYEVFEINVVLPMDIDSVKPRDNIDMVTLLTCTPYGINSHRLLVHGKQIETIDESEELVETNKNDKQSLLNSNTLIIIAISLIVIIIIIILIVILIRKNKNKQKAKRFARITKK